MTKLQKISLLAGSLIATLAVSASAALPAGVATTITGIQTDGQAMFDMIFPVVALFVGLGIVIKLFKRFTSKT